MTEPDRRFSIPTGLRTVRMRLTLTYSAVLFALSALLLGAVYFALTRTIDAQPLDAVPVKKFVKGQDGKLVYKPDGDFQAADLTVVQEYVNYETLMTVRNYSLYALAAIFVLSLAVGWWVAGRSLRPVGAITETAREINATDLSRRMPVSGPPDELRTLSETINAMLDRIANAFAQQRDLVDEVSHELRNPVASIRANVDAVLARDDVTPEQRAESAAVVRRATGRMTRLLEDLLATARSRSGAFAEQQVDISDLASQTVEEHELLAARRGLRVRLRLAPGPVVIADPQALSRAIGNVLANAVRLAPGGTEVTVASGSSRGWAYVAVRDEGPGIAPEDRDRIFDRFSRTDASASDGHGLGLAIARQVVEAHEGRIDVFSDVGVGSTFVLWLPDRGAPHSAERSAPPDADPLGRR